MSICAIQITLKTADNIPANYCTNTLHADIDRGAVLPGSEALYEIIRDSFVSTYTDMTLVFGGINQTGHEITFYDLSDPKPRIPFYMSTWDFPTAPSLDQLPHECSIVSSFKTNREAGKSDRNRRNRVYIGPISNAVLNPDDGRVQPATRIRIADAFSDLATQSGSEDDWTWVVYSPTLDEAYPVKEGFVDNAFDTQRRRGVDSTVRSVWTTDAS